MEKYSSKNNKYRLNGKFVDKHELPVGTDERDERYSSSCGKFYQAYHECLKDMSGDPVTCKMFRKRLQKCEFQKGYYDDIKKALKIQSNVKNSEN